MPICAAGRIPIVDADITAVRPSESLESPPESRKSRLRIRIVLGVAGQNADAAQAAARLRACDSRRERPRGRRRAAEQSDERAPVHCPVPPVLPSERIAHLNYCAAEFRPAL